MKIISKNRGEGKTTKLIKMSAETGYQIVVSNHPLKQYVIDHAKEMGLTIYPPITRKEMSLAQFRGRTFLIDELESFVGEFGNVYAATVNKENVVEDIKDNPVTRMQKSLDKLANHYDYLINKGDYNASLNVLKNIEMLSRQIKDIGYTPLHSIYKIVDNGLEKQLITLWEQNYFGDIKNVKTFVIAEKYNDTIQNWMQGVSDNWDNLSEDMKSDVTKMFNKKTT